MLYFRQLRLSLKLTQGQMAEACGLSRSAWQMIEYAVFLPSEEVALRICELSGLEAVPSVVHCFSNREMRSWTRTRPFELRRVNPEPWIRAHERCFHMTEFYRKITPRTVAWMEQMLPCHSMPEAFTWLQFAFLGGTPMFGSPPDFGFRHLSVMDPEGRALGERQLPGLQGEYQGLRYLVWPQVGLRPRSATFWVDGLMLLDQGREWRWSTLELDAAGHDPSRDPVRRKLLGMDEIRVSGEEIERLEALPRILEQAQVLLKRAV